MASGFMTAQNISILSESTKLYTWEVESSICPQSNAFLFQNTMHSHVDGSSQSVGRHLEALWILHLFTLRLAELLTERRCPVCL